MRNPTSQNLLPLACAIGAAFGTAWAQAQQAVLPANPVVAAGQASVTMPAANQLVVNQQSSRAVVNWNSFSLGAGTQVNFVQPGSQAAILNRVSGSTPSTIAGQLSANGQVFLVNPNGIQVTSTGSVQAAGVVLSTLDLADADFLAGRLSFRGTGASAAVANAGLVSASPGGYAALLGGQVTHEGRIEVPLGRIGLGAGERATLDLLGSRFLQVALPSQAGAAGRALIEVSGTAAADGGRIEVSAATAREALRQAVNIPGELVARGASGRSGDIVLSAGSGGSATVSGRLDVSSDAGAGGSVTITGDSLHLQHARIDASGAAGGGSVQLGGGAQGTGRLPHARLLQMDADSSVNADATRDGDGGRIVLWSDERTGFQGTLSARGAGSGSGGFAEVSSRGLLDFAGRVDLRAPGGRTGTLLLDPFDVTISTGADGNHDASFTATGNSSVVNVTTLQTALASANVTVSTGAGGAQNGDITVANAVSWNSGNTLTLDAARDINVNAAVTGNGGLQLTAGRNIAVNSNITASGGTLNVGLTASPTAGQISIIGATIATGGGNLTATAGQAAAGNGLLLVNAGLDVGAGTGTITVSSGANATFVSGSLQLLAAPGGSLTVDGTGGGAGSGVFFNTNATLTSSGAITVNGQANGGAGIFWMGTNTITAGAGALTLNGSSTSDRGVWFNGGANVLNATGSLSVNGTSNSHWGIGLNSAVTLVATGNASLSGTSTSGEGLWLNSTNSISANNGTLTLSGTSTGSYGAFINFAANTFTQTGSGALILNATSNSSTGLLVNPGVSIASSGNVTLAGNSTSGWGVGLLGGNTLTATAGSFALNGSSASLAGVGFLGNNSLSNTGASSYAVAGTTVSGSGLEFGTGSSLTTNGVLSLAGSASGAGGRGVQIDGAAITVASGSLGFTGSATTGSGIDFTTVAASTLTDNGPGLTLTGTSATGTAVSIVAGHTLQAAGNVTLAGTGSATSLSLASGASLGNTGSGTLHLDASGSMDLQGTVSSPAGSLWLAASGSVTQGGGSISAANLLLTGAGSYTLDAAGNQLQTVAANTGAVTLHSATSFSTGTVLGTPGVSSTSTVTLLSDSALTIGAGAPVSGTSPALSAGTQFLNNDGASALTATSGRWLVYAADPATSSFGGLDSGNTALWNATHATTPPGSVSASGNRYLFALQPTLSFAPVDASKVYGDDATAALQSSFTVSGYHAGVAGAFLADTAYSGAPLLSSPGAAATAGVAGSPYALSVAAGTVSSPAGYALSFSATPANLTVTQRPITVTADAITRIYGDANPALSYAVTSGNLVNGDAFSGGLTTTAGTASPVGRYAITQGTLDAGGNYALSYVPANLTITERPVTVSTPPASASPPVVVQPQTSARSTETTPAYCVLGPLLTRSEQTRCKLDAETVRMPSLEEQAQQLP